MKVDWVNAPNWANWYTEDWFGCGFWELEPKWIEDCGYYRKSLREGMWEYIGPCNSFDRYIEKRPTEGDTNED